MAVLSHSPAPANGGSKVKGRGKSACCASEVRGTMGRLKTTVTALSGSTPVVRGAGCTSLTSTYPNVWKSKVIGSRRAAPSALRADSPTVTR